MKTLTEIIRELAALQHARTSPRKIILTMKQPAARTLATIATAAEQQQPARPPVRHVASILQQLAHRNEGK